LTAASSANEAAVERVVRPLLDADTSVRRAVALALEEGGVDMVFGLPGGHTGGLIDALSDRMRIVSVREEALAGIMAQVYGRLTGRPAVAIGQSAFMLGAASGILEAPLSGTPMLVITDTSVEGRFAHLGGYQSGSGEPGSWDTIAAYRAISTTTHVARGGSQTVQAVQLGLKHALTEPGCATVVIPLDALRGRVGPASVPALFGTAGYLPSYRPSADAAAIAAAAQLLNGAHRPVILAGRGVAASGAYGELKAVAERLVAPIVTSAGGKGTVAETDPLALGVFGTFGTPPANAALAAADVVLVVGSRLSPTDAANENPALLDPGRQAIVQIDLDARHLAWTRPVDVALLGDAGATLGQLADVLADPPAAEAVLADRRAAIVAYRDDHPLHRPVPTVDEDRILPQEVVRALETALPADAIVCCDAGENRIFMLHYFRPPAAGAYLQSAGVGAMGYAIPAAMASKLAHPDRVAVAVAGDGGFGMTLNGLMTAIEEDLPIVVVVMNNRSLGWVRHAQGERIVASEYADFDLAAIARSMGCGGFTVERAEQLAPALEQAIQAGEPTVIDVRVSRIESFENVQSSLARH
jgi:acetolactate synthase-1/2/3 large subunit